MAGSTSPQMARSQFGKNSFNSGFMSGNGGPPRVQGSPRSSKNNFEEYGINTLNKDLIRIQNQKYFDDPNSTMRGNPLSAGNQAAFTDRGYQK